MDHYFVCIDVSEIIYSHSLWSFVTECEKRCDPVKLYIALPKGIKLEDIDKAKKAGIGIVLVNPTNGQGDILFQPTSLSLTGLRKFEKSVFTPKYRRKVTDAEEVFKGGDPNKACSIIYDEIEDLTRQIAKKTIKLRLWKPPPKNLSWVEKASWAKLVNELKSNIQRPSGHPINELRDALLSRVHGITEHRNQSGHKPSSTKALKTRDARLRTRLETAVDLLLDLHSVMKKLR